MAATTQMTTSTVPTAPRRRRSEAPKSLRREFERLDLEVHVDLASEHNFYTGYSMNISGGGLFIATHVVRPIGSLLEVCFRLPGEEEPIRARAQVRWVKVDESGGPRGLGLRFLDIDELARVRIQRFISLNRDPLFFEE